MEGFVAILAIFIGLPWLIFHYVTQWKKAGSLTNEDERLLDDMHETARRLDERLCSIERILTAENPNWRALCHDPLTEAGKSLPEPRGAEIETLESRRSK
ncbi:MAG: envelope stress response membrane protein PspB [Sphingomonadaceae bacterium]